MIRGGPLPMDRDGGQLSLDFLMGVTLLLLTFTFATILMQGLFQPFATETDVTTLKADEASVHLVEDLLVDDASKPSVVNWTKVQDFLAFSHRRSGGSACGASTTPYDCNRTALGLLRPERGFDMNVSLEYANGTVVYAAGGPAAPGRGNIGRTVRLIDLGFVNTAGSMENKCAGKKEGYFTSDCTLTGTKNWTLLGNINPQSLTCTVCITNVSALAGKGSVSNRSGWGGLRLEDSSGNWVWRTSLSVADPKKGELDADSCDYSTPSTMCDPASTQDYEDLKCEAKATTGRKIEAKYDYHPAASACLSDIMTNPKFGYPASVNSAACGVATFNLNISNGNELYGYYSCTDQNLKSTRLVVRVW